MKKKASSKTILKYLLILAITSTTLLFFGFRNSSYFHPDDIPVSSINEEPIAINHLISNELSDLPTTAKLDNQIEKFIKRWEIKGASIAIMKDEKLIYAKGYGWADQELNIETEVKHIFRIAS